MTQFENLTSEDINLTPEDIKAWLERMAAWRKEHPRKIVDRPMTREEMDAEWERIMKAASRTLNFADQTSKVSAHSG